MCSALLDYMSWSQTLVCVTWVITTRARCHFAYTEYSHNTLLSFIQFRGVEA